MICCYFLSFQSPVHLLALDVGPRVSVSVDAIMTPGTSTPSSPLPQPNFDSSETWPGVSPYTVGTSERGSPRHITFGAPQATERLRRIFGSVHENEFGWRQ
jgi:hypothetical protein